MPSHTFTQSSNMFHHTQDNTYRILYVGLTVSKSTYGIWALGDQAERHCAHLDYQLYVLHFFNTGIVNQYV